MAQFFDTRNQEETVLEIDNGTKGSGKQQEIASKSRSDESSSKNPKVSFEQVLFEAIHRRGKEVDGTQENQRPSFNASFRRNSWRLLVSQTKSRLIDQTSEGLINSGTVFEEYGDREQEETEGTPEEYYKEMKCSAWTLFQWVSLFLISAAIVCSLLIPVIKKQILWDLPLWKWEIMVFALICGRLVSGWVIRFVVIFVELNFLLKDRVLYFVYGLRQPVQNCLWLGLVLLVWHWIFNEKMEEKTNSKILPYTTRILVCLLIGSFIWLLKTLLVKVLASSFHVNTFFERIREALFNRYIIERLSGSPLLRSSSTEEEEEEEEEEELESFQSTTMHGRGDQLKAPLLARNARQREAEKPENSSNNVGKRPRIPLSKKRNDEEISFDHQQKHISAWSMRRMIDVFHQRSLCTLDEKLLHSDIEDESSFHIRSERQAKDAANKIFQNVAKPGSESIFPDDLLRFLNKEEAARAMHLFGATWPTHGISKTSLKYWLASHVKVLTPSMISKTLLIRNITRIGMYSLALQQQGSLVLAFLLFKVNAFRERKALRLSLNDTKTAVDELHNMLRIVVAVIIIIIWLIILDIPIAHFLVLISSQLLLLAFIFGNTLKTTFEAIVFLFIMHPFDVGDRCEIDGIQMVVEEMNILTTVFLGCTNQKIIYPNSVLATKAITNFYRSPDMNETIDFCIHISTSMETIAILKDRIKKCVEGNNEHWHPSPLVVVKDVEDMNKINLSLWVTHKLNFQQVRDRWIRRTSLVEQLIKVFMELGIEYRMLPLDVNVRNMPLAAVSD